MQLTAKEIDDFKTDRKDITPPLPVMLRLVPVLFYCSIGVAVILSSIFFIQYRLAVQKRDFHKENSGTIAAQVQAAKNDRLALEEKIRRATDIEAWVAGSRPLQPLVVEITRSMDKNSSIVDLRLDRDADAPSQLRLGLRLATDSTKQLDRTLEKVAEQDFRTFSPRQSLSRGELDYQATLVRQTARNPTGAAPTNPPAGP